MPTLRAFAAAVHAPPRDPGRLRHRRGHDGPGRRAAARRRSRGSAAYRNDLGRGVLNAMKAGIAAARAPYVLITMADGSDELRERGSDGRARPRRRGRRGRQPLHARRAAAGRAAAEAAAVRGPPASRSTGSAASPIHDATNNFKLYSRRFLDATTIESEAGFELALELSVKATLAAPPPRRGADHLARPDRRARAASGSASGCRTTSAGIAPRSRAAFGGWRVADGAISPRRRSAITTAQTPRTASDPAIPTGPPSGMSDPGSVEGGIAAMTLAVATPPARPGARRARRRHADRRARPTSARAS